MFKQEKKRNHHFLKSDFFFEISLNISKFLSHIMEISKLHQLKKTQN